MIRGCIFDMDGLLFDTERVFQETWQELAEERGIALADSFVADITGTSGEEMDRILETYYRTENGQAIRLECKRRMKNKLALHVPVKEGAFRILETCRSLGIRTAVASSSPMEQIRSNLAQAGMEKYFDALASGEEVRHGKPAPDIFLLAAEKIRIAPGECAVFEDSIHGIEGAVAARMLPVMIPDLMAPDEMCRHMARIYGNLGEAAEKLFD